MGSTHSDLREERSRENSQSGLYSVFGGLANAVEVTRCKMAGMISLKKFQSSGDLEDIDQAIACWTKALFLIHENHAERPMYLNSLGLSHMGRFERLGELDDIKRAIEYQTLAIALIPSEHAYKPMLLTSLGNSCMRQFERLGNLEDIERAIGYQTQAVSLTPNNHTLKPALLNNLGLSCMRRFDSLGELENLNKAIEYKSQAVSLAPSNHMERATFLNNLGAAYTKRFERLGELEDVDQAISHQKTALSITPENHAHRPMLMNNLGLSCMNRFDRLGQLGDIDNAIEYQTQAISLAPDGHAGKPTWLTNLGSSRMKRFNRVGELSDIDKAIEYQDHALLLTPEGHANRPVLLNNLGLSYMKRFGRSGALEDIELAIECQKQAVLLTPEGRAGKPMQSYNLGLSYMMRFERLGHLGDIDNAIEHQTLAVSLTPENHADLPMWLNNLGFSHMMRSGRLDDIDDIDKAIKYQTLAVSLTPEDHANMPMWLAGLGGSRMRRFEYLKDLADLNQAIEYETFAVSLTPENHAEKPMWLGNLGLSHMVRFKTLANLDDLDQAIEHESLAVLLTPDGHMHKPKLLNNLGFSYMERFKLRPSNLDDIDQAIECQSRALSTVPDGHAGRLRILNALGVSFMNRFETWQQIADLHSSVSYFAQSAQSPAGFPSLKFQASLQWARISVQHKLSSALEAYAQSIALIPQVVWLGTTVRRRYENIQSDIEGLAIEAASVAISVGSYDKALEWLEEGRSIVWNQQLQLRTPIEELDISNRELAQRFRNISWALDHASPLRVEPTPSLQNGPSLEQAAQQHRRLATEWEEVVCEIQSQEGFHNFLCPRSTAKLSESARVGPVVIINVHEIRCDALALLPRSTEVFHVHLPNFSLEKAAKARIQLMGSLKGQGLLHRGITNQSRSDDTFKAVLSMLWTDVAKPVIEFLGYHDIPLNGNLPRITWCTTGPLSFLPLHAAGEYSDPRSILHNLVVSSYTPTISALLIPSKAPGSFLGVLGVSQTSTPGFSPLAGTVDELDRIKKCIGNLPFARLDEHEATRHAVLTGMENYSWVHIACHASQNTADPTKSAFHLFDGALDLPAITKSPLKSAQFAFLSACQTATGDETLSNESVHLAAGMIMGGFPSVVATMWSIHDSDAPLVAERFYTHMCEGGVPDTRRAADALHAAVGFLRAQVGDKAFMRWVPYVHIGY